MSETKYIRGFYWTRKARDANTVKKLDILFGMYHPEGGTYGEMSMVWYPLDHRLVPKLEVFDDAWKALNSFPDVLDELARVDSNNMTEDEFVTILKRCDFKDLTLYERS